MSGAGAADDQLGAFAPKAGGVPEARDDAVAGLDARPGRVSKWIRASSALFSLSRA
jgi:hypothetical protein